MMADVAHTVPSAVAYLDGAGFGLDRPGVQVTPFISGKFLTRDWHGHNRMVYELSPALFKSADDTLEEWQAFWKHIDGGATAGYIVEPISATHRDLLCGGLGDGSKTTFPIPVMAPANEVIFVDGVPQAAAAYTLHSVANKLGSDNSASCVDADYTVVTNGTDADAVGVGLDGLASVEMTPTGGSNPSLRAYITDAASVSVGEDYTGVAAWLATASSAQNYRAQIWWFESDDSYISTSNGSNVSTSAGVWTVSSVTDTAPALAAKAVASVQRNDSSGTDEFYVDCLAVCPGDYDRWHLPSQAPGVIEFASAPSAGARVTATATGKRVTRCRFDPGTRWSMTSPGHASARSIRATEWIEF